MSRPTTAFESQSQAITNRMLGVKAAIDDFQQRLNGMPNSPHGPNGGINSNGQLVELGSLTEQLCQVQEQVQKRLAEATTIIAGVQQRLATTLTSCEQFATGLAFDIKRMMGNGGIGAQQDPAVLSTDRELLLLHTHAMNLFSEVLTMQDAEDQEAILRENDELFDERDRLMSQFTIQSQAASQPQAPTRSEKSGGIPPPGYSPAASDGPSVASSSAAPPPPDPGEGGITGWFKTLKSLPSLLRRVEPLVSPLCQAAAVGSTAQIDGLLSEGANIEGVNEDGNTPLISAVLAGQVEATSHLLDKGAKLTSKDTNKVIPPLFHAALAGKMEVMKLLLDRGADANAKGTFGNPFFVGAVADAPLEAVRLLLDRGADANTTGINGKHIAVAAAQRGDVDLVKLLLDRGARTSARAPSGQSLIGIAADAGNVPLAKLLLDRDADVNSRMPSGVTILCSAVSKNNLEMTELLLAHGADADAKEPTGQSLVSSCVSKDRNPEILKLLLEHGAGVTARDYSNRTPLSNAMLGGKLDLARTLLQYGSDPSDMPSWEAVTSSPLGNCIQQDRLDGVRMLLEFHANPNRGDQHGQTPLLYAVSKNKLEAVKLLLGGGGNPNVRNSSGETALVLAVKEGNIEMVRLLLERGALVFRGPKSAVETAKKIGRADIMRVLEASRLGPSSPRTAAGRQADQDAPPAYGE